ncbi:MAG: gliding motility-associated C-terminal domain-containing protein, partial [Bacteroidota bacterium]
GCETLTDAIEVTFGQGVSVDVGADQTLCQGETLELNVAAGNATYLWQDGSTEPTFSVTEAGIYEVTLTSDCGTATDQIEVSFVEALSLELGANQQLCDGQSVTLDATNTDATYTWQDGSTNPTFEVTQSGTYEVTITNGCETLTDQIEVTFGQGVSVDLGADRELCVGEELELNVDIEDATLRWQDGSSEQSFIITEAGVYWLEAVSDCETIRDSVVVTFVEVPSIDLGEDQQLCEGDILELQINEDYAVRWQDGSTQNTFTITQAGTYSVELANQCGRAGDAITVNYTPDFELDLGADQRICEGENLMLESGLENVDFRWQDGSTDAIFSTDQTGVYWLEASNECFVHFDSVEVVVQNPPTVELGEGGLLCEGDVVVLDASSNQEVNYTWSDGSTESSLEVTSDGIYQVTVSNECGRMDDFIRFTTPEPIEVDLGQDTTLCEGATHTLLANANLDLDFRWQDGSIDNRFIVDEPGEYLVEVSNECETVIDVVNVVPCQVCDLYAPNVFSPNFDGRNERFSVFPSCQFLEYQLQVYDRWGTLIFQSEDREEGWMGLIGNRPAPQGVYVWKIKYMVEENYEMSKRVEVGEVTLLR